MDINTEKIVIQNQIAIVQRRLEDEVLAEDTIRHLNRRMRELKEELDRIKEEIKKSR